MEQMSPKSMTEPLGICGTTRTTRGRPAHLHTPSSAPSALCRRHDPGEVARRLDKKCPQDLTSAYLAGVCSSGEAQNLNLMEFQRQRG